MEHVNPRLSYSFVSLHQVFRDMERGVEFESSMMSTAAKIKKLRGSRSYASLGEACGCAATNMHNYATGTKVPFKIGVRLAVALGVDPAWLADDEQDWPPPPTEKQAATAIVERALTGAGLAGELNDDERELVSGFRALNGEARGRVLGMIDGLNASNASPPDLDPDLAEEPPSGRT